MEHLKVAIGCDHGGFDLKQKIMSYLDSIGVEYKDFGTFVKESCDYPEIAQKVSQEVISQKYNRGILICGTGLGMSIAANKVKGIRAVCVADTYSARVSRAHNNANILCMGQRVIGDYLALDIVDMWLKTGFEGGRHKRRVDMLELP